LTCKASNGIPLIGSIVFTRFLPSQRLPSFLLAFVIVPVTITLLPACKDREEIKVYRVSKAPLESPVPESLPSDNPAPSAVPAVPAMPAMAAMPGVGASTEQPPSEITSIPPVNWQPQSLSSMRQASYLVKGDNGATADISLVILPGPAGGVLENVNRWLSQLGQPAIDDAKLAQMGQHVTSPLGDVAIVDLEGLPPGGDGTKDGRIIGGIAVTPERTIFFKMHGNAALAESQKEAFIHWIGSIQMAGSNAAAAPAVAPDASTMPPALPPAADSEKPQIKWEVPDGWKPVPAASMRYASFAVAGQNGGTAEISVVVLDGEGGGDLQNVNRWRSQIGLPPVTDNDLKPLIIPAKAKDGDILTVDMAGSKSRILAGWTRIDGKSWFFKLTAPDALATAEKQRFTNFLQSVQFHP